MQIISIAKEKISMKWHMKHIFSKKNKKNVISLSKLNQQALSIRKIYLQLTADSSCPSTQCTLLLQHVSITLVNA